MGEVLTLMSLNKETNQTTHTYIDFVRYIMNKIIPLDEFLTTADYQKALFLF